MRGSQRSNTEFIDAVKHLKAEHSVLSVLALSNMPELEFGRLKQTIEEWGIFDGVIDPAALGCRKPDTICYKTFLEHCNLKQKWSISVDDRLENIVEAQSL